MSSKSATLTTLPVELVALIARFAPARQTRGALALSCKYVNDIVTPVLYMDIAFHNGEDHCALACCITLSSTPRLACLVQSLHICLSFPIRRPPSQYAPLCETFWTTLVNLSALRHLVYDIRFGFDAEACRALAHTSSTLESLTLHLEVPPEKGNDGSQTREQLQDVEVHFPRLTKLRVNNGHMTGYDGFFRRLALSCSTQIVSLALPGCTDRVFLDALFACDTPWSSLKTLSLSFYGIGNIHPAQTSTITSLKVRGFSGPPFTGSFLSTLAAAAFPSVTQLQCYHHVLPHLLRSNSDVHRPISTLALTNQMSCEKIIRSLPAIDNSATPLTNLTLPLSNLHPRSFDLSPIASSLSALRHIKLQFRLLCHPEDLSKLGDYLFAHTPDLRVFAFLDQRGAARKALTLSWDAQSILVAGWGKLCPHLRRVSLAQASTWIRRVEAGDELGCWQVECS